MIYDIKIQHFHLNRLLLLMVGLWPYQRSKFARLQAILSFCILTSFVIFQFTTFATAECTADLVIKVVSSTIPFISCIVTYNSFWFNGENMMYLMDQLQHICIRLTDENEISIIEKYAYDGKCYTNRLALFGICGLSTIILVPMCIRGLSNFALFKEYRSYRLMFIMTEYFIDPEKYFYLITLHMDLAICILTFASVGVGTVLLIFFKYICGMFRIASYRIEQAITIDMLKHISSENEIMIKEKIIFAVDIHRKAMELSTFVISCFKELVFILLVCVITAMSLNLFRIFQIISLDGDSEELPLRLLSITTVFLCMFLPNYIGQEVKDHNNDIYLTVYNVQWYRTSLRIQKLILFLLKRSNKVFSLNIGVLTGSLECFATLASTSVSYFTVIFSTQR